MTNEVQIFGHKFECPSPINLGLSADVRVWVSIGVGMRASLSICAAAASFLLLGAVSAHAQQTTGYTYDALGRLVGVVQSGGPANGASDTYTYDPASNRTGYVSITIAGLSIASASANEGSPLTFIVSRSGLTANAVTVNYATSNGTAIAGTNYTASSGTLSFAAGVTTQTFTVPTINNQVYAPNATMTATLSSPSPGASLVAASASGTIVNIDAQPTLSIATGSANEGSPLTFTVSRLGSTGNALTVNYATTSETAVAGTNYTSSSGTLSFAAGVTSQSFTVPTIDDHIYTSNLTMTAVLSSPTSGVTLGPASATGTVVNIDAQPSLSIAGASTTEGSPLTFTVSRSGATGNPLTVNYATSNGTAIAGTNYTATGGALSFAAGVTSQSFAVQTINAGVYTSNITMTATLSGQSPIATIGTSTATGQIQSTSPPEITATNAALGSYGSGSVNTISITTLTNLNGRPAQIISFVPSSGGGAASIVSGGQSLTYTAPDLTPYQCQGTTGIIYKTFTAAYSVKDTATSVVVNGSSQITAQINSGSTKSCGG